MSFSRPAIIVTPSTPMATPKLHLDTTEKPYCVLSRPLTYMSSNSQCLSPPEMDEAQENTTMRRIHRRVQLAAALLALLLSAMAFATIIHPTYSNKTTDLEQQHGLFGSMRVG